MKIGNLCCTSIFTKKGRLSSHYYHISTHGGCELRTRIKRL